MHTIQSITRQVERLCNRNQTSNLRRVNRDSVSPQVLRANVLKPDSSSGAVDPAVLSSKLLTRSRHSRLQKFGSPLLWILAIASLTSVMGVRFYNQPKLAVGREAIQTLYAPADAIVLDAKTTEEKRKEALYGVVPVLVINSNLNQEITGQIQTTLRRGETVRVTAAPFPFVDRGVLSTDVQNLLRQMPERYWQELIDSLQSATDLTRIQLDFRLFDPLAEGQSALNTTTLITPETFKKAVKQLYLYQQGSTVDEFEVLIAQISAARRRYAKALAMMSKQFPSEPEHQVYDLALLEWPEKTWIQTKIGIEQVSRQMLSQGIAPGLPDQILQEAVRVNVEALVPPETQDFAVEFLSQILVTNLIEDREATRKRAELAAQEVQPVYARVERGEAIVQQGEEITQREFVLLDHFERSERSVNWRGVFRFVGLITIAVVVVVVLSRRVRPNLRRRDYLLILLMTLSTPVLILLQVPSTDLSAVGLLIGSFYGSTIGVTVVMLLTALLPVGLEVEMVPLLASAAGGILGSLLSGQLRSREELALLGGAVGLAQGTVYLIITLILSATAGSIWYVVLGTVVLKILEGLAWSIVALGVSPYLEHLFDLITPIRLAELANPNRPLLKRLATEAPGTFQHTMFVATLAEAAAQALGCNVELVRTGTLYHDIGKMHDPLGFIENQMGGP
ncbi:MAG: HDIG domain-containing protein, partial [Oscillatoriales cyanobacterium RM1_1_9]|nr:HDIG domain-containing protein [Oscillatoriales cyanobacterium RM1_1_9]